MAERMAERNIERKKERKKKEQESAEAIIGLKTFRRRNKMSVRLMYLFLFRLKKYLKIIYVIIFTPLKSWVWEDDCMNKKAVSSSFSYRENKQTIEL